MPIITGRMLAVGSTLALLAACTAPTAEPELVAGTRSASESTVDSRFPGVRTIPDLTCPEDYAGTTGLVQSPPSELDLGDYGALSNGPEAPEDIAASLPSRVHLKGRIETYTDDYYFAVREGMIWFKPNIEVQGVAADAPWKQVLIPRCLEGQVSEISADGFVLLALNAEREIYTLDYSRRDYGIDPWTRRWGPFFWTDLGGWIPDDVRDWAASELHSGVDEYFVDGGGRQQKPWGILTVYLLRGDGRHITYLDPWLPMDESREVCGPERGTVSIAGLAGSGSTVMVVTADGRIFTRLYEFDVSGANTFLLDYSWQDQEGVENPLIQLPAPGWIEHPRVPGEITDRLSLRKISPGTEHRIMRVEGRGAAGNTGYWEKDLADRSGGGWSFVVTGEPLLGRAVPRDSAPVFAPEDFAYYGVIDGHPATITSFNPHCSPTTLRIEFGDSHLDLTLHTTDGLRQERRTRGLDLHPRHYRSAIELPRALFDHPEQLPPAQQEFIARHFAEQRFIAGPLLANVMGIHIAETCWEFQKDIDSLESLVTQPPIPDAGILVAEIFAEQEQGRSPPVCLPLAP